MENKMIEKKNYVSPELDVLDDAVTDCTHASGDWTLPY